jgi:hypothetical protein
LKSSREKPQLEVIYKNRICTSGLPSVCTLDRHILQQHSLTIQSSERYVHANFLEDAAEFLLCASRQTYVTTDSDFASLQAQWISQRAGVVQYICVPIE